jgi:NADH:ubiquinone oxidoreductase subunit H
MWDLKLYFSDAVFCNSFWLTLFIVRLGDFINPIFLLNFTLINNINTFYFAQNLTFFTAIKFGLTIMFLILIRGGTPRYRYDYLTKLGWLKFLGFIVALFLTSLFFYFLF